MNAINDRTRTSGSSGEAVHAATVHPGPNGQLISVPPAIEPKGEVLGIGCTGLVELLKSGDVIKSPGVGVPSASECWIDLETEMQIYKRLGTHARLIRFKGWDPAEHTLLLEYMPNGNLKKYIEPPGQEITPAQRRQWALQAAEGVELLHSRGVVHADVRPQSFLLDADLSLKIANFAGSSLDGSEAKVVPASRYLLPLRAGEGYHRPVTVDEDLFALGSTIYFIAAGREPIGELEDEDEIEERYKNGVFPDLNGVLFAEVIAACWRREVGSSKRIVELLRSESS